MAKPDLIAIAQRVSDGESVDWDAALRETPEGPAKKVVRNLRLLESLSSFHRTGDTGGEALGPDATRTVASGDEGAVRAASLLAPMQPFTWGPLEVRERLGEGGFGEVFRAWDPTLQREVALKLLKREHRGGAGFAASVLHEARLLARVRHGNVVTVYGADTHDGRVGLWMELVRGRSLAQWVEDQGRMGAREAAILGVDLCRALAAVHGVGLVHRDVKAGNVMREEGGRILLMDFGAVSDAASSEQGSVSGTPRYIAPEIYGGEKATPRSDLFSLGVLLYHLVTGRYPIDARTVGELRERIGRREARLLRDERPDLPEGFVQVVERALAWRADDRFSTAGSMEQALSSFLGGESRPSGPVAHPTEGIGTLPAPSRSPSPSPRRSPWILAAATVAVLVLATLVAVAPRFFRGDRGPSPDPAAGAPSGGAVAVPATGGTGSATPGASPYSVEASLLRVHTDGRTDRLDSGSRLALGDRLALEVRGSVPLHVYVIDEDEKGHAFALFPLPGFTLQNPLAPETTHLLPGTDAERRQSYWSVTSSGGREHLLIVASPERVIAFEAEMARLPRPEPGASAVAIPDSVMVRLRGIGGLVRSTRPAPAPEKATGLFEMAEKLAGRSEKVEGAWVRRLDVENPAP